MIKEFPVLDLRNAELLKYSNSGADLVEGNNPTTLKVAPQLSAFKSRIAEAEALFILPRESAIRSKYKPWIPLEILTLKASIKLLPVLQNIMNRKLELLQTF
jgi:hypothetical protein